MIAIFGYGDTATWMANGRSLNHHSRELCTGDCCLHGTSTWQVCRLPATWRSDRRIIEHHCPHGVGHPCPNTMETTHGCCAEGCCR